MSGRDRTVRAPSPARAKRDAPTAAPGTMRANRLRRVAAERPGRAGFSTIELIVVLAILAVLAAVIAPNVLDAIFQSQSAALARSFDSLSDAITEFRADIGRYPSKLSYLSSQPSGNVDDTCGRDLNADWSTDWNGPYVQTNITSSGITVGSATIQNDLRRDPATLGAGTVADLLVDVEDVDESTAEELDDSFDGDDNLSAGSVRWVDGGGDRGTLTFAIRIRGC